MSNTSTRLARVLEMKGMSVSALENKIGASNGTLSKPLKKTIEKGIETEIGIEWVIKILEYFQDLNAEWFLLEKGQIFRKDSIHAEAKKSESSAYGKFGDDPVETEMGGGKVKVEFDDDKKQIEWLNQHIAELEVELLKAKHDAEVREVKAEYKGFKDGVNAKKEISNQMEKSLK